MKNSIIIFVTAILCILTGCQEFSPSLDEISSDDPLSTHSVRSDSCHSVNYPTGWELLTDYSLKVEALQLDSCLLKSLTTEELVEWCAEYPLALDCFAFNDINIGINTVMERFNGFAELASRDDCFEALRNYYISYIDKIERLSLTFPSEIKPLHWAYLEYIFSSEKYATLSNHMSDSELISAFIKSARLKKSMPKLQGCISKSALQSLSEKLPEIAELKLPEPKISIGSYRYTIYTKKGLPVIANHIYCVDTYQEEELGLEYLKIHESAKPLDDATCTYNCHAYAWYISEGGEHCWIDAKLPGTQAIDDNVKNFWEDGTYVKCDSIEAEKVFYYKGDHSAIVVSPGVYISKWGPCHVFQHAPNDCPYISTDKRFYKKRRDEDPGPSSSTYYGVLNCDQSTDPTPFGATVLFNVSHSYIQYYRFSAYVSRLKSPEIPIDDPEVAEVLSVTHQDVSVRFNKQGSYVVNYCVYHKASGHLEAVYQSQDIYVNYEGMNEDPEEEI